MNQGEREKLEAGEIRLRGRFITWLDNYWYHYKWHTLFALFGIAVVLVCVFQMRERVEYDFSTLYAGKYIVSRDEQEKMQKSLSALATSGEFPNPKVNMTAYYLMTSQQLADLRAENEGHLINTNLLTQNSETFRNEILSGSIILYFMDEALFLETGPEEAGFVALREYVPDLANEVLCGEYGVYLRDTALAAMPGFSSLPDDTVVAVRGPISLSNVFRQEEAKENHRRYEALFRRLMQTE